MFTPIIKNCRFDVWAIFIHNYDFLQHMMELCSILQHCLTYVNIVAQCVYLFMLQVCVC